MTSRIRGWIRGRPMGLVLLAVLVGLGAGLGAIAFRFLIVWFTLLFTGHADYSAAGHDPNPHFLRLGMWFVVLTPVVGGLIYGPLVQRFAQEARGHGVPEVMLAVAERGSRIRARIAVVKALASALCIGAGGSVGREGPIVQIGSAIGSGIGQVVKTSELRMRLLVASGAAGGIAATFNAPIAGVMFALELILRDVEAESFGVVVIAAVAASAVGRAAFGSRAFLVLPPFELGSPWEYGLHAGLGVLAALVGIFFIRALYGLEDFVDRLWRGPEALRPAVGGLALGIVLLALPQMYGVGYPVVERAISGGYAPLFLLLLLAGKILATSLSIAIGGSGGVFAPSMFMGAMLGSAYGQLAHRWVPGVSGSPGAYGVVAMGAVFAAAGRAPFTAAIVIFELTGEYRIILPLLLAVGVATMIANLITRDTIYTLKLQRRGIDVRNGRPANPMQIVIASEAMQPVPVPLRADQPLAAAVKRLTAERQDALPVVDADGRYAGTVTTRVLDEAVRENVADASVADLVIPTPTVATHDTLEKALGALVHHDVAGVAVVDGGNSVVGWLTRRDVLRAYQALGARDPSTTDGAAAKAPRLPPLPEVRGYRIVEIEVRGDAFPAGHEVGDLSLPASAVLLSVARGGRTLHADGELNLQKGDRLTVLVREEESQALIRACATPSGN